MCDVSDADYHVFFSYARADAARIEPLRAALEAVKLKVWFDEERIEDFQHIERQITQGLARSKAVLACYSATYPTRAACRGELTAALIAGGDDHSRILVVNLEAADDHIASKALRDRVFAELTEEPDLSALAQRVLAAVNAFNGPFGPGPRAPSANRWVGLSRNGGPPHFIGRQAEIWRLHAGMAKDSALLTQDKDGFAPRGGTVMLRGLGGIGKSLLAEVYARRFAGAWPGGVFWLRAGGDLYSAPPSDDQDATQRTEQYRLVAEAVGAESGQNDPAALRRAVITALEADARPYLWVVDDLPQGATLDQAKQWLAPTDQGYTLFTTRNRGLSNLGGVVDLDVLSKDDARALLTHEKKPSPDEEPWAQQILDALGGHALAVDVARHLVKVEGYRDLAALIAEPDGIDWELVEELPNGHEASIVATLSRSLTHLKDTELDLLRVAALGAPQQPLPFDFLAAVLTQAEGHDVARRAVSKLAQEVAAHSLCDVGDGRYQVHGLVRRTVLVRHSDARLEALRPAMIAALLAKLPEPEQDIRGHGEIADLIPHAQALAANPQTEEEADILYAVGSFFLEAGLYADAQSSHITVLNARQGSLKSHPLSLAASMQYLSISLACQYDFQYALMYQYKALEIMDHYLKEDDAEILKGMNNLAGIMNQLGDHKNACNLHRSILKIRRNELGEDHPETLGTKGNLAIALNNLGKHSDALALQKEIQAAHLRKKEPLNADALLNLHNLALTQSVMGEVDKAIKTMGDAVTGLRDLLGPDHSHTKNSEARLAEMRESLGRA